MPYGLIRVGNELPVGAYRPGVKSYFLDRFLLSRQSAFWRKNTHFVNYCQKNLCKPTVGKKLDFRGCGKTCGKCGKLNVINKNHPQNRRFSTMGKSNFFTQKTKDNQL